MAAKRNHAKNKVAFKFPDDVPQEYRDTSKYETLKRGATAISLTIKSDPNHIILITPDSDKVKYLCSKKPQGIGIGELLEQVPFTKKGIPEDEHYNKNLFVIKSKMLYPLSLDEAEQFIGLRSDLDFIGYVLMKSDADEDTNPLIIDILEAAKNTYRMLAQSFEIAINHLRSLPHGKSQIPDFHAGNMMKDANGNIILIDPFIAKFYLKSGYRVSGKGGAIVKPTFSGKLDFEIPEQDAKITKKERREVLVLAGSRLLGGVISRAEFVDIVEYMDDLIRKSRAG